ncbi:PAAR domain-containing protein [Paraburkholderia sp.]|jgi:uncharacterized Zn-binding protein involved in type VI secretion|uniref:PAAR domain-containing protein n=1 Tax=Paraburkholderia sp. TaxID=1926495 RepID=UPI002F40CF37
MRKAAVRHGDKTTTRGYVLAYSSTIHDDGKKVALSGDEATCGNCKGTFKIFGTGKGMSENGRDVVVEGDLVLCPYKKNRVIVGSNPRIFLTISEDPAATLAGSYTGSREPTSDRRLGLNRHFRFVDEHDNAVAGIRVYLMDVNGETNTVTTDSNGCTPIMEGRSDQKIGVSLSKGKGDESIW